MKKAAAHEATVPQVAVQVVGHVQRRSWGRGVEGRRTEMILLMVDGWWLMVDD